MQLKHLLWHEKKGKEVKSAPPNSKCHSSGINIKPATAKGIITDKQIIIGIYIESLFFIG